MGAWGEGMPVGGAEAVEDELRLHLLDLLLALQACLVGGQPREGLRGECGARRGQAAA